jgi:hypothetical protein
LTSFISFMPMSRKYMPFTSNVSCFKLRTIFRFAVGSAACGGLQALRKTYASHVRYVAEPAVHRRLVEIISRKLKVPWHIVGLCNRTNKILKRTRVVILEFYRWENTPIG